MGFFPMTDESAASAPPEGQGGGTATGHEGTAASSPTKKYVDKFDTPEALEQGYREVERFSHMTAQQNAELKKQMESDRALLQQALADKQGPAAPVADDDDELLDSMAATLGVSKDRVLKLIDGRAGKMTEGARKVAEAANQAAIAAKVESLRLSAEAKDKEIGNHWAEIDDYLKANPAMFQFANPFTKAWQEMSAPRTEADRKTELERIRQEAYEEGRQAAANKAAGRTAPRSGGVAGREKELSPLQQKSMAIFGTSDTGRNRGFFPRLTDE